MGNSQPIFIVRETLQFGDLAKGMTGQSFGGTWEESRDQSIQIPEGSLER